jgi:dGTPase
VGEALARRGIASLDMPPPRLRHETIRRVIDALVTDLLEETRRGWRSWRRRTRTRSGGRAAGVGCSVRRWPTPTRRSRISCHARMYRHWRVNRMTAKARRLTEEVFRMLHADPSLLPDDWRARAGEGGTQRAAPSWSAITWRG